VQAIEILFVFAVMVIGVACVATILTIFSR
jgi:hypothetical protein